MFGLLAYPAMGIYKSLGALLSPLQKQVLKARLEHDEWLAGKNEVSQAEFDGVLKGYESLIS